MHHGSRSDEDPVRRYRRCLTSKVRDKRIQRTSPTSVRHAQIQQVKRHKSGDQEISRGPLEHAVSPSQSDDNPVEGQGATAARLLQGVE